MQTLDKVHDQHPLSAQVTDNPRDKNVGVLGKKRAEAFEIMIRHAQDVGATGIVAVRYDATEVMSGVTEVLCYGTAVQVAPA